MVRKENRSDETEVQQVSIQCALVQHRESTSSESMLERNTYMKKWLQYCEVPLCFALSLSSDVRYVIYILLR